ncbi:hypothetical protein ON010_g12012 [Phytophthora cinnamomi]|nr:hypothetical protein ON010_g12012 [Phytophthora cinnamomi]
MEPAPKHELSVHEHGMIVSAYNYFDQLRDAKLTGGQRSRERVHECLGSSISTVKRVWATHNKEGNAMVDPSNASIWDGHLKIGPMNYGQYLAETCRANLDITNTDGKAALVEDCYVALLVVAENDHCDTIQYFTEEYGADMNANDYNGTTALMAAATSNDGTTALMQAAGKGRIEVVEYLAVQCDAGVNDKDNSGTTALMRAAYTDFIDVVGFFVSYGTNVNLKNDDGYTALMMAAKRGRVEIARYLVEHCDADVNLKAMNGVTAVRLAANGGYDAIKRILTPSLVSTVYHIPRNKNNRNCSSRLPISFLAASFPRLRWS